MRRGPGHPATAAVVLGLLAVLHPAGAVLAADEDRPAERGPRPSYANPSAVIAAELGFARDAQARGQWTAFAASAANDAVMFVPQMVWAQVWLKGRANPPRAVHWQPHAVWSSCDGSLMVSRGAWQGASGRETGWFTTLWQRQGDGSYKWVLDHGDAAATPLPAPDMIAAEVADCPPRPARPAASDAMDKRRKPAKPAKPVAVRDLPPLDPAHRAGAARDGSLRWAVDVAPDGGRRLQVLWRRDGAERVLLDQPVAAPAQGGA